MAEACLVANVFVPAGADAGAGLPVGAFIHGGHFTQGSIDSPLYSAVPWLTAHPKMVVVSFQYRMGALGFLSGSELDGTFGFTDQQVALQWIQANIGVFGGDASKVTLFGESAGASSIGAHLVAPGSAGLYRAAIMESNPWTLPFKTSSSNEDISHDFTKGIGCDISDINCLQAADINKIVTESNNAEKHFNALHPLRAFMPWTPVVGGNTIPVQPRDAMIAGQGANVPMMLGHVANETVLFIYEAFSSPLSTVKYDAFLLDLFNVDSVSVGKHYPRSLFDDDRDVLSYLSDFFIFQCPSRLIVNYAPSSAYFYFFDHVPSFAASAWGPNYPFCHDVVCHGNELAFVWGTAGLAGYSYTSAEQDLVTAMQTAWTSFITTGGDPGSQWPAYNSGGNNTYIFSTEPSYNQPSGLFESDCDYFDIKVGYNKN
jgi:carboxylesterase type B